MKYDEYNEIKQHGAPDFPIQLYRVDPVHPQYVMPLHRHKEFEMVRVISGKMVLWINNVPLSLSAGDIAFVGCKALHRSEPTDCRYECIVCDLSMLVKKNSDLLWTYIEPILSATVTVDPLLSPNSFPLYETVCRLFAVLEEEERYYELETVGLMLETVTRLYRSGRIVRGEDKKNASLHHRMGELLRWIENNHAEHLSLGRVSQQFGLSPNYVCRIFKEYTGKTLMEYVNAVRIEHVCHDLKWGQKNITEAALNNGFNDISYFCKVFKKHVGISAGQYLKENKTAG